MKSPSPSPSSSSSSSSSSSLSTMKIKNLIQTLIHTQACRLIRAISKAKSIAIQIYKDNNPIQYLISNSSKKYKHKKLFFGSFRLHYNWCSSHVTPVPAPVLEGCTTTTSTPAPHSTWNSAISTNKQQQQDNGMESELSGYLQWLEENKVNGDQSEGETEDINEIDELAEMFIANCHEKFMLEKQESYRRFQEMMARSM